MGTEQSTANHSYTHNNISPDNYSRPYSFSPNTYHSAVSSSDLKHAYSYGNIPSNIRSGMSRTFCNVRLGNTFIEGLPSRPVKTEKTIFIEADNGKRAQVTIQISEEENLTCGWLVSETIRQFADRKLQEPYPNRPIVVLQTVDDIITMDYWLSDLERPVSALKDGMVLKPFYGSTEYIVTNQKVNLNFFYLLKVIGTGGFSKVYLARRKDNGQFYAIKVITKKEMLKKDKEENVFNERNIMTRLHHPFLVKLSYAFQTPEKLFLVMDFCPGGELFYHLSLRKKLREEEAKVYMGEIILALNYLHKNNVIYRDLKPENILLDVDGHLHLADFGLCKVTQNKQDLNYTFCGSPEYMAPEIIKRSGYNFSADFYTLGTLIYEMVVGRPPFNANRNKELFEKILHQDVSFPSHISPNLKMFLSQLLDKNPTTRLGSKYGLSEIVNHPWCRDLDFVKIASKKMAAPIVPDILKTNFAREFIDARVTCIEDGLTGNLMDASPQSRIPSMVGDGASEMENPAMYRKFANFSFYSNIDDPYEKFHDSIFGDNTPDTSPKVTRSASKFDTILTPDLTSTAPEKSSAETDQEKNRPVPLPNLDKMGKSSKEDYTDDINEKSPHINNLSEYNKAQAKFIKTSERSMTPRFPGQGLKTDTRKRSEDRKSLPIFKNDQLKSKKPPLSYYGLSQNSLQTASDQSDKRNKIFVLNNSAAQLRVPELDLVPKNFDDISEEIMTKNDKPFTHIDSSRTVYRESQLAHLAGSMNLDRRRTGPRLSGVNINKTYSFMNFEEGVEDNPSNPTSVATNLIPADRFKKQMGRTLDSERVKQK